MAQTFVEFKAIKPKPMDARVFKRALEKSAKEEGKLHQRRLKRTVTTWRNKPDFTSDFDISRGDIFVLTGPTGSDKGVERWVWTDKGTRPRIIRARNAPALRFQTGFTPKTRTGQFRSGRSRKFGPWRRPKAVSHPGTKARNWSKILSKEREKPFATRTQQNISRAARHLY